MGKKGASCRIDHTNSPEDMWWGGRVGGCRVIPHGDGYLVEGNRTVVWHGPDALLRCPLVEFGDTVAEGRLIARPTAAWHELRKVLLAKPLVRFEFRSYPRRFEEMVAGAYYQSGAAHVVLTSRSSDRGRDVIAYQRGWAQLRVFDQAKAYGEHKAVRHDDVRAFAFVVMRDLNCSKGHITTTSRFPAKLQQSDEFSDLMPYRLELRDGEKLIEWLRELHG